MAAVNQPTTDAELMRRIGGGDAAAYRAATERHLQPVHRYATRLLRDATEAEDVTQETFLRLWTTAADWKPEAALSTWLHRIAHNLCLDRLRSAAHRTTHREPNKGNSDNDEARPTALERAADDDRPSDLVMRKQTSNVVDQALNALPDRQRAAIVLVHYQGMSNPEAAEVLDVGVEAVESLLARARRTLRESLAKLREGKETP